MSFLDAAGIGALIAAYTTAHDHGLTLRVHGAAGIVRQVLEISGTAQILAGRPTPDQPDPMVEGLP